MFSTVSSRRRLITFKGACAVRLEVEFNWYEYLEYFKLNHQKQIEIPASDGYYEWPFK